ncbi:MAG: response regulator transcription factor [Anaerolineae bacterium]|nr:response regulator transcription factor [Anaerolineae bacterium]MCO5198205.1 response regulator transcription factor [Anaerolineae bacterium]
MSTTILIVDDDKKMRDMLRFYLEEDDYRILEAANGREALYVARYEKPDLILLDLMMPEMDGTEFMRIYRREANTPVIMLTAKVDDADEVLGLEMGADDYITKPFSVRSVRARVRSVLRRAGGDSIESDVLRAGDLALDRNGRILKVRGELVDLTPSEYSLLELMMANAGRAFSRIDLLEHIAADALETQVRTIDVHIRHLRAKIEPDAGEPRYIQTVYGMGYRFMGKDT